MADEQGREQVASRPVDADNHYYETLDAFTRHLDRKFRDRGVRVFQDGRHTEMVIGGKVNGFIPNPTFDPVIVPGCLDLQFRGQIPEGVDPRSLTRVEPIRPEYRDREARLATMDAQGLDAILLFPTLGCGVEQALRYDVPATMASLNAFNRWLEDDWGYFHQERIISAPMLSLADPEAALAEVDRVLGLGARVVHVRPAPVPTGTGKGRSLGNRAHDPVWARLAEAGVPVAFHLGDSGYNAMVGAPWGGAEEFAPFRAPDLLGSVLVGDRAIHDTVASLIVDGVFTRHPTLKVASIENGSDWVYPLVKGLRKLANRVPSKFAEDPLDTIRKHIWVTPYYEEDLRKLADTIGVGRVLFGSDWPHGEGLADPAAFTDELTAFSPDEVQLIMRTNCAELIGLPTS
ncbi:Predicted metal-dependent hydrolase, TIM-barrel fold [Parafrankia irregularis]|uniref:Predicted metal-dependent hydrolase, TIM-barrel fold n=1 Tax=Parafrankia irregularis TaxID=795642 RepID=A0A0S4QP29_9ACTN|nr:MULTISPECIES: amidohydrolase family protein [Parafrankia]MBE3200144.1 amidohydrolase [Parafrankia sp. CH37]CUU56664.1 Predicted metal-dependent hydrolase, TIM-barrel fold [Parafrankia irregularis]